MINLRCIKDTLKFWNMTKGVSNCIRSRSRVSTYHIFTQDLHTKEMTKYLQNGSQSKVKSQWDNIKFLA